MTSEQRYVLHAYNTTQNVMVQGRNCEAFAVNCLKPYFVKEIESNQENINLFNAYVQDQLSSNPITQKACEAFKCALSDKRTLNLSDLKVHLKSCHSKPTLESPQVMKALKIHSKKTDEIVQLPDNNQTPYLPPLAESETTVINLLSCKNCDFTTSEEPSLQAHCKISHETNVPSEALSVSVNLS